MGKQPQVITAVVLYEPGTESLERTTGYVISALKASLRNIRGGAGAVVLFNEEGKFIGSDVSGEPTQALSDEVARLAREGLVPPKPDAQPPLAS